VNTRTTAARRVRRDGILWQIPGTEMSVVNSYSAITEQVEVSLFKSVDLPTEGNPTRSTCISRSFYFETLKANDKSSEKFEFSLFIPIDKF